MAMLRSFQPRGDSASKSRVADTLRMLERSGWINKEHGKYSITYCVHAELNRKPRILIKHSSINCYCTESRH
ncbi:protein of unknown function [Mesotoga infera]|uniref:Uncharacterized protein n=1 Tax=Mesotoga infera TaxID=1236046 RepID=A0A7Z7LF04_9BACT|nr:protein of unknown function [Mesotoga infera]